jgi:protein TonB
VRKVEPFYPPLAREAGVEGPVVVEIVISEEGDVTQAAALSGHPLLRDAAVAAARGWKFRPALVDGKAVKVVATLTFNFSL